MNNESGKLFICGTPIGNIRDISLRCLDVLKSVDIIACEDTRQTLKLLNHYDIKKKLVSYHEHNKKSAGENILKFLLSGKNVALVTDAGMPCISDPGSELVELARKNEISVEIIPGPTAFVTALALSGLNSRRFIFEGFISLDKVQKKEFIERIKFEERLTIIYEAPHRLLKTLEFLFSELGERKIFLARELTKIHEEIHFGTLSQTIKFLQENPPRGEYVIIIGGAENNNAIDFENLTIEQHIDFYLKNGYDLKSAIKKVARDRNIPKNQIYSIAHKI